ncbi:hypothetical protein RI129_008158 [Pyrocoelia pectoralis]|uniref:C2H2-type domain-containing protein n=1 Tax=Pyrocoelia pectoralis TaxID=417401 RepID=A0AAN7ZK38_9COLE
MLNSFIFLGNHGKPYICFNCGRSYKYTRSLRLHVKYECGQEPKYACHVCNYKCKQKGSLKRHVIMTIISDYGCMLRNKPDNLKSQMRHPCKNCNKSYKHRQHLTSHLKYECGKEPQFQCHICYKKYHQKYTLNHHIRVSHLNDIKFI